VSLDEHLHGALHRVDRPRLPREAFADGLRERLRSAATSGDGHLDQVPAVREPEPRGSRRRFIVAVGVLAAAAALLVAVVIVRNDDVRVDHRPVPASRVGTLADACREFRETAFAPWTHDQVVGSSNAATLTTVTSALHAIVTLRAAVDRFAAIAGRAWSATVATDIARIRAELDAHEATLEAAAARGDDALGTPLVPSPLAALRRVGDRLRSMNAEVIRAGGPSCF